MSLEQAARTVLDCYPAAGAGPVLVAQGNRGGFSGARLWRATGLAGPLCLRAWPTSGPSAERLEWIHFLMRTGSVAGLAFVPAVFRDRQGHSWQAREGRLWEVTAWMPGRADFREQPTGCRLHEACAALARLHVVWAEVDGSVGVCPAIAQRLDVARTWRELVASGWQLEYLEDDPVAPWARRAWTVLPALIPHVRELLAPWQARPIRLQPCLCDIWHDHVLFVGDAVSGIVDYGGVKPSHVSADLARLLGSLVGEDAERRQTALAAYRQLAPLSVEEAGLLDVLDQTGCILGAANWLRWLYHERRNVEDRQAVAGRLAELVPRLERMSVFSGKTPLTC
jgi:Ser/Thr protein kinase RdoA (MazF antagonist)